MLMGRGTSKHITGVFIFVFALGVLIIPPAGAAQEDLSLAVAGQPVVAEMYIEDGRAYLPAQVAIGFLKAEFDQEYVALREVFEAEGAVVSWDSAVRAITVSWPSDAGPDSAAADIALKAEEYLYTQNTYRMQGSGVTIMHLPLPDAEALEIPYSLQADVQLNPTMMYLKQEIDLSPELLAEISAEEVQQADLALMTDTEMLITDTQIFQKYADDWIVIDFADLGMEETLQYFLTMDPAASMEMALDYGVKFTLVGEQELDGIDHYVVRMQLDQEALQKILDDFIDFDVLLAGMLEDNSDVQAESEEARVLLEQLMANMELAMDYDMYVEKENYQTNLIKMDTRYAFTMEVPDEEPVQVSFRDTAELTLKDFGADLDFPEITEALTMEEFMEVMLSELENDVELE